MNSLIAQVVILNKPPDFCIDAPQYTMTEGSPPGGTYTGVGINNGVFNPRNAGVGTHSVTYTYTNSQGTNYATNTITVYNLPNVIFNQPPSFCIDASPYTLLEGSPKGGIYTGAGISNGEFSASGAGLGTHSMTYTFTDSHGCPNYDVKSIEVYDLPSKPIITLDGYTLISSSAIGNQWYRNDTLILGATDSIYIPTQIGTYSVKVSNQHGCSNISESIEVTNVAVEEYLSNQGNGILQIFPNPSPGEVSFVIINNDMLPVSLLITNSIGIIIAKLIDNEILTSKEHTYKFMEKYISSGLYLCILKVGNYIEIRKFLIIK